MRTKPTLFILLGVIFLVIGLLIEQPSGIPQEKLVRSVFPSPTRSLSETPTVKEKQELFFVTKVIDGDTIEIEGGKRVRYIGIDTPETKDPRKGVECFGHEAAEKNRELVSGKNVRLEKDILETDKFGRLLRYVFVDDLFINDYLVRQGYALVTTFPPDVKYQKLFIEAQKEARENKRGLWSSCK